MHETPPQAQAKAEEPKDGDSPIRDLISTGLTLMGLTAIAFPLHALTDDPGPNHPGLWITLGLGIAVTLWAIRRLRNTGRSEE